MEILSRSGFLRWVGKLLWLCSYDILLALRGEEQVADFVPFVLTQDVVNDNNDEYYDDYEHSLQRLLNLFCFLPTDIWRCMRSANKKGVM